MLQEVHPAAHGLQAPVLSAPKFARHDKGSQPPAPLVWQNAQFCAHAPHDAVVVPFIGPVVLLVHRSQLVKFLHEVHVLLLIA